MKITRVGPAIQHANPVNDQGQLPETLLTAGSGIQLGGGEINPDRPGIPPGQPGGKICAIAPQLDHIKSADVTEHADVALGHLE